MCELKISSDTKTLSAKEKKKKRQKPKKGTQQPATLCRRRNKVPP